MPIRFEMTATWSIISRELESFFWKPSWQRWDWGSFVISWFKCDSSFRWPVHIVSCFFWHHPELRLRVDSEWFGDSVCRYSNCIEFWIPEIIVSEWWTFGDIECRRPIRTAQVDFLAVEFILVRFTDIFDLVPSFFLWNVSGSLNATEGIQIMDGRVSWNFKTSHWIPSHLKTWSSNVYQKGTEVVLAFNKLLKSLIQPATRYHFGDTVTWKSRKCIHLSVHVGIDTTPGRISTSPRTTTDLFQGRQISVISFDRLIWIPDIVHLNTNGICQRCPQSSEYLNRLMETSHINLIKSPEKWSAQSIPHGLAAPISQTLPVRVEWKRCDIHNVLGQKQICICILMRMAQWGLSCTLPR
jgi:hypothetical protein